MSIQLETTTYTYMLTSPAEGTYFQLANAWDVSSLGITKVQSYLQIKASSPLLLPTLAASHTWQITLQHLGTFTHRACSLLTLMSLHFLLCDGPFLEPDQSLQLNDVFPMRLFAALVHS